MSHKNITKEIIDQLINIVGAEYLIVDVDVLEKFSHDETEDLRFYPEVVVKPRTAEEISAILKLANIENIPVTPRGGGTGLSGGALAIYGGILISMERFNEILEIDDDNNQATVEPGVITEVFQNAVKEKGLFYPPDPSSKGSCFLGGNLGECAGGPKAVKYGVTRDYILNLQVVLPTGEIIWTGANVLKNSTGYNLTQLLVGSEGTLGIITQIVFRLIPLPKEDLLMLIPFLSEESACNCVKDIFKAGITPSCMEFMERDAIMMSMEFLGDCDVEVADNVKAHLLIDVDGNDADVLLHDCEVIMGVAEKHECGEVLFAESDNAKNRLWRLRRNVAEAVKADSVYKEEDTVVPRAQLAILIKGVKALGVKYGFKSVCYGHAGDGNVHVNILKGDMSEEDWNNKLIDGIREIFELVKSLGGTISGEHGIGLVQKEFMDIIFDEKMASFIRYLEY